MRLSVRDLSRDAPFGDLRLRDARERALAYGELAERMRQRAEEWQTLATNATARIERVTAALDERREEYVEKRDAAVLPTTRAIYQAFIDAIDRIKKQLEKVEGD